MAASSSKISEDEKIFAELVNYVDREIPIICVYAEEDVDLCICDSSSRSVPVNIVNDSIEDTVKNSLIEDTVNNEDSTNKTTKALTSTSTFKPKATQAVAPAQSSNDWGKSLTSLLAFGIKEIEEHRKNSGKTPETAIIKTLDRGRKFFEERYISANNVYCKEESDRVLFKASCKASMQKKMRDVNVEINKTSSRVVSGKFSCPAGKSGCNHVMALLFEIADYSLKGHKVIPIEVVCTSRTRQWGVSGKSIQAPMP